MATLGTDITKENASVSLSIQYWGRSTQFRAAGIARKSTTAPSGAVASAVTENSNGSQSPAIMP